MKKFFAIAAVALTLGLAAPQDANAKPRGYRTETMTMADGTICVIVLYYEKGSEIPQIVKIYVEKNNN